MNIKRINKSAVQKICSNQVIVSVRGLLKELLENSLDAGSDKIEIRLKNFGADLIEVHDNGCGIRSSEFTEMAKRHTTSKIENFEDISEVKTFGFRGEALNSISCIGDLQIHTKSDCSSVGFLLVYDNTGTVISQTPTARQRGTTVTVKNIFHSLPVRRKQLLANLKREFDKAMAMVTSYSISAVGVQLSCCKIDKTKQVIVSNGSAGNLSENIQSVLGSDYLKRMVELIPQFDIDEDIIEEFGVKMKDGIQDIRLKGWISKPYDCRSVSCADRQFLYVNGRPCDVPKLTKTITECYKEASKVSFVILIEMPQNTVDINLEPDKMIFLFQNLPLLQAVIKACVIETLENCGYAGNSCNLGDSLIMERSVVLTATPCKRRSFQSESAILAKLPRTEMPKLVRLNRSDSAHFSMATLIKSASECLRPKSDSVETNLFRSRILPEENETAEQELRRLFRKEHFLELVIVGQFNKGFILAKRNNDLFIVDQHASDERFQLERLTEHCRLSTLPLACPQRFHLSPGDDQLLRDNISSFEKLGFRFIFEKCADDAGGSIYLTSTSSRQDLVLGLNDVQEILQTLKDTSTRVTQMPSRLRSVIASNACRSAVMIGTSLTSKDMKRIVHNMASLKDPWICAHGRPTMRHVCSLDDLLVSEALNI